MGNQIEVVKYDPRWADSYRAESKIVKRLLGRNCTAVYHIGSTAVEGMLARPAIDMLAEVKDLTRVDSVKGKLEMSGYSELSDVNSPGCRRFVKGGDAMTHQLCIFAQADQNSIQTQLAVVEYLRSNEKRREEYSELKTYLAQAYPNDPQGYAEGKAYFAAQLEQEAMSNRPVLEEKEEESRSIPVSLGMGIGLVLGLTLFDNIGAGLCVGLGISLAISKIKGK